MIEIKSVEEFIARVKRKESVSRLEVSLGFTWDYVNSRALVKAVANLRSANLSYANLSYAELSYANLSYADLSYADLRSADLSYADLSYANLRSANLRSANLSSANLRSANLRSANLSCADLSSANLSYANLRSANLKELHFEVGFSYALPCGTSYAELITSVKGASQDLKDYLLVQSIAHLAAEKEARNGKTIIQFVRDWLEEPNEKKAGGR